MKFVPGASRLIVAVFVPADGVAIVPLKPPTVCVEFKFKKTSVPVPVFGLLTASVPVGSPRFDVFATVSVPAFSVVPKCYSATI